MNIQQQRITVGETYANSKKWTAKLDKMSDRQIHAIFMNLVARGKVKA